MQMKKMYRPDALIRQVSGNRTLNAN